MGRAETLPRMLAIAGVIKPLRGNARGRCMVCGAETADGVHARSVFSDKFTEYNKLRGMPFHSSVLCPYCAALVKAAELRRRSWLATRAGLHFLTRSDALNVLLDPPEPPWYIYLTRSRKKAGFLAWPWPNLGRSQYTIVVDGERIAASTSRARRFAELARRALESGIRKSELVDGCAAKSWGANRSLCVEIERVRRDPLWEVIVWLV